MHRQYSSLFLHQANVSLERLIKFFSQDDISENNIQRQIDAGKFMQIW